MPSQRQLRVGELIRRELADILARQEIHDPELNRFSITVGEVQMTSDLKIATVYMLPLGGDQADDALEVLTRNAPNLRRKIDKRISLKFSPSFRFKIDDTFDRMDNVRRLFQTDMLQRDVQN